MYERRGKKNNSPKNWRLTNVNCRSRSNEGPKMTNEPRNIFLSEGKFFAIPNINTSGSKRRLELGQKYLSMLSRRIWINSHTYNFVQKTIYPYIRKYYGGYNFSSIFFIWKSVGSIKFRSMIIFFYYFHWHKKGQSKYYY